MNDMKERFTQTWKALVRRPAFYGLLFAALLCLLMLFEMYRVILLSPFQILFSLGLVLFGIALSVFFFFFTEGWISRTAGWVSLFLVFCITWSQMATFEALREQISSMCAPLYSAPVQAVAVFEKDTPIDSDTSLRNRKVGLLSGRNDQLNETVLSFLEDENIEVDPVYYETIQALMQALKGQTVSALIFNDYDLSLARMLSNDSAFLSTLRTRNLVSVEEAPIQGNAAFNTRQTPYTVLVRMYGALDDPRVYDLALLVVNPVIRNVTSVVIPRDYYVSYGCEENTACAVRADRLGFADYMDSSLLKEIVESLLNVPVDFVADISMSEILELFDLDPITVENGSAYTFRDSTFEEGELTMIAEKAKLFAQTDLGYMESSRAFMHNSWKLLARLFEANRLSDIEVLERRITLLTQSIHTSFSYEQLCRVIQTFFFQPGDYTYTEVPLEGNDGFLYSAILGDFAYFITPIQDSLNNISQIILYRLNQRSPDEPWPELVQISERISSPENDGEADEEKPEENQDQEEQADEISQPEQDDIWDLYYNWSGYDVSGETDDSAYDDQEASYGGESLDDSYGDPGEDALYAQ